MIPTVLVSGWNEGTPWLGFCWAALERNGMLMSSKKLGFAYIANLIITSAIGWGSSLDFGFWSPFHFVSWIKNEPQMSNLEIFISIEVTESHPQGAITTPKTRRKVNRALFIVIQPLTLKCMTAIVLPVRTVLMHQATGRATPMNDAKMRCREFFPVHT